MSDLRRTSIDDISGFTGPIFVTAQPHPPTTHISSQPRAMKFIFSYELLSSLVLTWTQLNWLKVIIKFVSLNLLI